MILIVWIIGFWQLTSAVNPRALETDGHVIYPKSLTRISQDQIVVELKLQDEMLSIYLKSNKNLFSKQSLIIEYSSQKSHPYNDLSQFDSCYYSGQVNGIYNSLAALSVCNGLKGFIYYKNKTYFIEPASSESTRFRRSISLDSMPHSVYSSSIDKNKFFTLPKIDSLDHQFRAKRAVSIERYIETLVVADYALYKHFKEISLDVVDYLFTVLNMVATIYQHHTIGVALELNIVRMIIVDNQTMLELSDNIVDTLNLFCEYQQTINKPLEDAQHHDVAILISQLDFNDSEENLTQTETLGLAKLGGICDSETCCNVNQNNGLSLAFTIAHELGHNLNADHDSDMGCDFNDSLSIMQSNLRHGTNSYDWSECSRNSIKKFLDEGYGKCLEDKPSINLLTTNVTRPLPGTLYDYDEQCKLKHGLNASHCDKDSYECSKLWCRVDPMDDKCISSTSVAEGTLCGTNVTEEVYNLIKLIFESLKHDLMKGTEEKWCLNGECVLKNVSHTIVEPLNGNWSEWEAEWSNCSHECDGGIQQIRRYCNNPTPMNGGKFCLGTETLYRTCNMEKCSRASDPFLVHNSMCLELQKSPNWQPLLKPGEVLRFYYNRRTPCKLLCLLEESNIFIDSLMKLPDGTKCSPFKEDLCINGECRKVGCDKLLDSNKTTDKCNVCGGDNSSCTIVQNQTSFQSETYGRTFRIKKIKKGAVNILIAKDYDNSFLLIKNTTGHYILNNPTQTLKKNFLGYQNGVDFSYEINDSMDKETLSIQGPTPIDIIIEVFLVSSNVTVNYEYSILNQTEINSLDEEDEDGEDDDDEEEEDDEESTTSVIITTSTVSLDQMLNETNTTTIESTTTSTPHAVTRADWIVGNWSNTCETNPCQNETREVKCGEENDETRCDEISKPESERACQMPDDGRVCKSVVINLFKSLVNNLKQLVQSTLDIKFDENT